MAKKTNAQRFLAGLILLVMLASVMTLSCAAADNAQKLTLSFWTGYDNQDTFRLDGLLPGDKRELIYEITVKSKDAKSLAFDLFPVSGDTKLTEVLTLRIEAGLGTRDTVTYTVLYDGSFDSFDARELALTAGQSSQTATYRVTLGMLTSANDDYEELSLKLRLEWRLGEEPAQSTEPSSSSKPDTTVPKPPETTAPKPPETTTEPEPDTSEPEPDTSETEPDTSETEPDTSETEPDTSDTEPDTSDTEPDTSDTEPLPPDDPDECECPLPWCHTKLWGCICPWCWIVPLILLSAAILLGWSLYERTRRKGGGQ